MRHGQPLDVETIIEALEKRAARTPDALAFNVEGEAISHGQLLQQAREVAGLLHKRGLSRGDRCALLLPTSPSFIRALFGVQLLGATPVALNTKLPPALLHRRLAIFRPRIVVCADDLLPALRSERAPAEDGYLLLPASDLEDRDGIDRVLTIQVHPDDPAYFQLTSGTTGEPRAAMISHRSLVSNLKVSQLTLGLGSDDILVSWLPLYHDMGLVRFVFGGLYMGCETYLLQPAIANLDRWLQIVSEKRGTITSCPDFGLRIAARIVDPAPLDLSSLRHLIDGGEPVRANTIETFERIFKVPGIVHPGYGLAEATLSVTVIRRGDERRVDEAGNVSCGRPYIGTEVRIVDPEDRALPPGEPGEIAVRGGSIFSGYFDDEENTRAALRDGWLYTGDIGKLDDESHLYVLGRKRALIKRGGTMIAPREIEEVVDTARGVRFSAAFGHVIEPAKGTEEVIVVVEVRPEALQNKESRTDLAGQLARSITEAIGFSPREILLVKPHAIPLTANGKIRHDKLSRIFASGALHESGAVLHGERFT